MWVAEDRRPGQDGPARWVALGPDGSATARVDLPAGSDLLWAAPHRVLLRLEDELGRERVELRRLAPEA